MSTAAPAGCNGDRRRRAVRGVTYLLGHLARPTAGLEAQVEVGEYGLEQRPQMQEVESLERAHQHVRRLVLELLMRKEELLYELGHHGERRHVLTR